MKRDYESEDRTSSDQPEEVVGPPAQAAFYRRLVIKSTLNLVTVFSVVAFDFILLKVLQLVLPESDISANLMRYFQVGVFLTSMIMALGFLLITLHSVYLRERMHQERILLELKNRETTLYARLHEDVNRLLGEPQLDG